MQYAEKGNLETEIYQRFVEKRPYSEEEILEILHQVSNAIKYMHDLRIIHRDIKCENILISYDSDLKMNVYMLGDFSLSKKTMAQCGTCTYMSP
jgi:serine/threonine protein kinase